MEQFLKFHIINKFLVFKSLKLVIMKCELKKLFLLSFVFINLHIFAQNKIVGKKIYTKNCLSCHQLDGSGVPHLNPPLDESSLVNSNQINKLIKIVLFGMTDRIKIDGKFYSNNMAAYNYLTNNEIAAVLNYIRNEWSNKNNQQITAKQVEILRKKRIKGNP